MKLNITQAEAEERFAAKGERFKNLKRSGVYIGPMPVFKSVDAEKGIFYYDYDVPEENVNVLGGMHGSLTFGLLDNAMGTTAATLNPGKFTPTVNVQMQFMRPLHGGDHVEIEVNILKMGKRNVIMEAEISKSEGVCIVATSSFALLDELL